MIELPEAVVLAEQFNEAIYGKKISRVIANHSPHKFAWYHGDPERYHQLLHGRIIGKASAYGSFVEINVEDGVVLFSEGINLRYHGENERPKKHQLLIEFDDSTAISGSVQMYGGLWCFEEGEFDNIYYQQAKEKPSPLSDNFDKDYFDRIISGTKAEGLSAKALIATEQRIPGLGNGVLQDILFNAKIHPKKKLKDFSRLDREDLYNSIKTTLSEITEGGGRDTEKNLYGFNGGYKTKLSKNTVNKPCCQCGSIITKGAYMGGSIYFCSGCQSL
ncbi:DNA-formamidopyrimidine glycosylase family protein [Alkaliphilus serpentinus]|uniref:Endonuclease VIII n=1 Tax=Alkaliphilus serpentinus TaxID=1482731 RepID=A0A833HR31_9FIRM|nr:DNA-formamidopyrimidine glycosylase family protein [Alkaliphilus serpentinus]KAB3532835.1 endonuclease VIII [Alkaliphilus serpentinus]